VMFLSTRSSKRTSQKVAVFLGCTALVVGLSGCSSLSRALGSAKHSPDEFAVVTKAPLVIPPDFSLRPPKPGARRPQERSVSQAAADAVFQSGINPAQSEPSDGEQVLLATAGALDADSSIRDLVDSEFFNLYRTNKSFANKVLFWQGDTVDPGTLLDSGAEAERIKEAEALGEPISEGTE
jgi:DUF3035 family protein